MKTLPQAWPLLLLLSSAAAAQPVPANYEPQAYCISLGARTGARSAADVASCVADELRAQASLAVRWENAPSAIREHCLLRNARHSYDLLNICVETEMERAR